ncbi:hypothetical protein DXG01_010071 [Tephrocybe rancida]|nr:hypothetical protein DXG01_010071 [Tephrocybe rancida]
MPKADDIIPPLHFTHEHFARISHENFTLYNIHTSQTLVYHAMAIKAYILHDAKLRTNHALANLAPGGYTEFQYAFNDPSRHCQICFANAEDTLGALANYTPPTIFEFNVRMDSVYPRGPIVEEGGHILDKRHAQITDELLWESADTAKKKIERIAGKKHREITKRARTNQVEEELILHAIATSSAHATYPSTPSSSTAVADLQSNFGTFDNLPFQTGDFEDVDQTLTQGASGAATADAVDTAME